MKKSKDYWCPIYEEFTNQYTDIAENVVNWYPSGQSEITIKLKDGRYCVYDFMHKYNLRIRQKNDIDSQDSNNEEEWRTKLSKNLRRKLYNTATNQDMLAMKTGISEHTISKYVRGKSTPTAYNLYKIARALNCSVTELME